MNVDSRRQHRRSVAFSARFAPRDGVVAARLLAGGVALAALFFFVNRRFYEDDALITLRYCRSLLHGDGLVWNAGERVEGYSNFLYLMLVAALGALHVDLRLATRLVGAAAYVATAGIVYAYGAPERRAGNAARAAFPVVIVLASCPLVVWTLGGLEGPLCGALAVGGVALIARNLVAPRPAVFAGAGALFALGTMTRIDACLFAVGAVPAVLGLSGWRRSRSALLALAGTYAAVYAPYFAWRYAYYGELLPNTFYAKGTSTDAGTLVAGARYVLGVLLRPPFLGVWITVGFAAARRHGVISGRLVFLSVVAGTYLVFPVFAGGDHMAASRFMVPVIPVLALVLHETLVGADFCRSPGRAQLLGAALLACVALQRPFRTLNPVHADPAAYLGVIIGDYANAHWPAGSLVAVNAAGAVPYAAKDLRFLDMLGLNDRHIAHAPTRHLDLPHSQIPGHRKGDGSYVLTRVPDFIIFGPPEGTPVDEPWWVSDYEIEQERALFDRRYQREDVQVDARGYPDYRSFPASASGMIHFVYYRLVHRPADAVSRVAPYGAG